MPSTTTNIRRARSVTGPDGGPWRIETNDPSALGHIERWAAVQYNELKPHGTKVSVDWEPSTAACEPSTTGEVHADISGLAIGATYHYRVTATSSAGKVYGGIETLTTTASKVHTGAATEIEPNSATLNGTVDPENLNTTYYFEYGRTPAYGSTSSSPPGKDVGTTTPGDQPVSRPDLRPRSGQDLPLPDRRGQQQRDLEGRGPDVHDDPGRQGRRNRARDRSGSRRSDAARQARPGRGGNALLLRVGAVSPLRKHIGDAALHERHRHLARRQAAQLRSDGLHADTTYHYRIVAVSNIGTTYGNDQSFTTTDCRDQRQHRPGDRSGNRQRDCCTGNSIPTGSPRATTSNTARRSPTGRPRRFRPASNSSDSIAGVKSVQYVLEGLEPGTTYHYRIVAANYSGSTVGNDQVFTTTEGPAIEGVTSEHVTASSAELVGKINPDGYPTEWYFEYGLTPGLRHDRPGPARTAAGRHDRQPVSVSLTGLQNTTYHFRLVAKSEWGTVESEDQTFEFVPPVCPNSALRQQTGANYLPDCRAYELVTPARAGGTRIFPIGPFSPVADDHSASRRSSTRSRAPNRPTRESACPRTTSMSRRGPSADGRPTTSASKETKPSNPRRSPGTRIPAGTTSRGAGRVGHSRGPDPQPLPDLGRDGDDHRLRAL